MNQLLQTTYEGLERTLVRWLASHSLRVLRVGMGIIFLWFGMLKFFPGLSPAQDLALNTIHKLTLGMAPAELSLVLLAMLECAIGMGFLTGRYLRVTLLLLIFQMIGTLSPLVLFPNVLFQVGMVAPTLEGQYIIKNVVLIGAGLVIGATLRGGYIVAEPALHGDDAQMPPAARV
jgi:uncharacterized membrane protein YkgB